MQTDATTSNIVGSCSGRYWMSLAVVCKRTQLLPTLLGVVPADIGCFCQWCVNGRNYFHHCWELFRQILDVFGSGVQTDTTTSNIVGSCSGGYWMFLPVVCKRTQLLPPLLGVVPADVRCCCCCFLFIYLFFIKFCLM